MNYVQCHALDNFASIYFTAAFSFVYFQTISFKTLSPYALLHHTRFATIKFRHSDIHFTEGFHHAIPLQYDAD